MDLKDARAEITDAVHELESQFVVALDNLVNLASRVDKDWSEQLKYQLLPAIDLTRATRRFAQDRSVRELHAGFGSPGDYGTYTRLGKALTSLYASQSLDTMPPAIEAAREWWHRASIDGVLSVIDAAPDKRSRELAIVLCAESVAHLTDDPRVAECRRVRLAWVRGAATDEQRNAARNAAGDAALEAVSYVAMEAAGSAESHAAWAAVSDAAASVASSAARSALAAPLRTLYPDPTRLDWRDGLARWDVAVEEAHAALRKHT